MSGQVLVPLQTNQPVVTSQRADDQGRRTEMVIFHNIGPFKEVTPALNTNVCVCPLDAEFIASFDSLKSTCHPFICLSFCLSASLPLQLFWFVYFRALFFFFLAGNSCWAVGWVSDSVCLERGEATEIETLAGWLSLRKPCELKYHHSLLAERIPAVNTLNTM